MEKRLGAMALAATAALTVPSYAQQTVVTVGTGAVTGVYYAAGGAACFVMNRARKQHGFRCSVESTGGSIANLSALRNGELDFALVQSDWHHHAVKGDHGFAEKGPDRSLRSLFSMHTEPMTILAGRSVRVKQFTDFKGKRFNVGNAGSGTRASMLDLLESVGMRLSDFSVASGLDPDDHGPAFCDGRVDGVAYVVGHPSANVAELVGACGARLVPLAGSAIERLVQWRPYYAQVTIPAGTYKGQLDTVPTYGVLATMVANARTSPEAVYAMTKAVFSHLADLKGLHPALARLDPKLMSGAGMTAPLHEGAARYYREAGLMESQQDVDAKR